MTKYMLQNCFYIYTLVELFLFADLLSANKRREFTYFQLLVWLTWPVSMPLILACLLFAKSTDCQVRFYDALNKPVFRQKTAGTTLVVNLNTLIENGDIITFNDKRYKVLSTGADGCGRTLTIEECK